MGDVDHHYGYAVRLYLAEQRGQVVGMALLTPPLRLLSQKHHGNRTAMRADPGFLGVTKVSALAVRPDRRGEGIGSDLLAYALAREPAGTYVYGQCSDKGTLPDFYRAFGFTVHSRGRRITTPYGWGFLPNADHPEEVWFEKMLT